MRDKKGFTLIELLVVVLIIGILAAIAVPKYQLAIDQVSFKKYQMMVATLRTAYNEHLLATGQGTKNFAEISLSLPKNFTLSKSNSIIDCFSNDEMFCCMSNYSSAGTNAILNCGKKDLTIIYSETYYDPTNKNTNKHFCAALPDNSRANRLCRSLGTYKEQTNSRTPDNDWHNTYNFYTMDQ